MVGTEPDHIEDDAFPEQGIASENFHGLDSGCMQIVEDRAPLWPAKLLLPAGRLAFPHVAGFAATCAAVGKKKQGIHALHGHGVPFPQAGMPDVQANRFDIMYHQNFLGYVGKHCGGVTPWLSLAK